MKKILPILFLFFLSTAAQAALQVQVSVSSIGVSGLCNNDDCTSFCLGIDPAPADAEWEANVSDNRDYSEDFAEYIANNNSPGTNITSGYDNVLSFNKTYSGVCPPNFLTISWEGHEYDALSGNDAVGAETFNYNVPTTAGTYTISKTKTAPGSCGTVTWTMNFSVTITGTADYICSDTPCAADVQVIQDPCDATLIYKQYDVSSSTSTFSDASTGCGFDGSNDIFFKFVAPAAGAFTLWVGDWDDWGAATTSDLTGNIYGGASCSSLSIASGSVVDGDAESQSMGCIDFSSGLFNTYNEGPFNVTGLTPGSTYYLRVSEEDDQPANVTLAFAEKLLEDDCVNAQQLTGVGCNYNAYGNDFLTPFDLGVATNCGWSSMDNSVFYDFTVTASTPQPVSVTVKNIVCDASGGGTAQLAIWKKPAGICTNSALQTTSNYVSCASGTGTITVDGGNLPVGDYLLVVDGTAGAQCKWEFESVALLSCSVSAIDANIAATCNDNGTPTDATDDYYLATVTVTYNNPPATGNLVLSGSAIAASTPSANLTQAVGALATPAVFNNIHIKAGVTNQTITAAFSADGTCTFSNNTISSSAACATTCPTLNAGATGSAGAVCSGASVSTLLATAAGTITLTGGTIPTDATIAWFDDAAFTTPATTNPTNTTCSALPSKTYYAQATCVSNTATTFPAGSVTITVYPAPAGFTVNPVAGSCGVAAKAELICGGSVIGTAESGTAPSCAAPSQPFSGAWTAAEIAAAIGNGATASCYSDLNYGPIAATCAATPTATVTTTGAICVTGTGTSTLDLSTLVTVGTGGTWGLVTANGTSLAGSTLSAGTAVDAATAAVSYTITGTDCADQTYDATITVNDCTVAVPTFSVSITDPCQCHSPGASSLTVAADGTVTDLNGVGAGNSNGLFDEVITATYDADNGTAGVQYDANVDFRVVSVGPSVAGGAAPAGIANGDILTDNLNGTYEISFEHTSGVGYTATIEAFYVADPDGAGPLVAGSAVAGSSQVLTPTPCVYPEVVFSAMPTTLTNCAGTTLDLLTLTNPDTDLTFDGGAYVSGTTFNAVTAGVGTHTVTVGIDPVDATPPASQDGNCLQPYTLSIGVTACPPGCAASPNMQWID